MMNINNNITIHFPKTFVFGQNSLKQLETDFIKLGKSRLYILSVASIMDQLLPLLDSLKTAGIAIKLNLNLSNEPTFTDFKLALQEAQQFKADSVLGIGGGSVMDLAKIVAVFIDSQQEIDQVVGIGLIKERKTWLACIPTTSGTGSEMSPNSILLDERDNTKKGIISPALVPDCTYIDPVLTLSVPPAVTAFTGIDALTHCIEAYANKYAHPVADTYALKGIELISKYLKVAYNEGTNLNARSKIALGSVYGGICLGPVNTGAVHALAYPLGTIYKIPHGLSNAILLPYVTEFNLSAAPKRYAEIAIALGAAEGKNHTETAANGIALLKELLSQINIPKQLSDIGVLSSDIPRMAEEALKIQRLLKNNVREVTLSDAIDIYTKAF